MTTTIKRRSLCLTLEMQRQIDDLCERFGENPSQVMMRALQVLHYSLRFPNVPLKIIEPKPEKQDEHGSPI
jgi:hypothetical protein